jgi:hypothetical protein
VKDWVVQERHVPAEKVTVIRYGIEAERDAQASRHRPLTRFTDELRRPERR